MAGLEIPLTPSWPTPLIVFSGQTFTGSTHVSIANYGRVNLGLIVTGSSSADTLTVMAQQSYNPGDGSAWTTVTGLVLLYTSGAPTILTAHQDAMMTPGLGPYLRLLASVAANPSTLTFKSFLAKIVARE